MRPQPSLEEVPFAFEELFFSRTDERGIILSGNSVFQRISQYDWDELVKRPHNIIRHPDMPKGVFYLLWHFLKAGNPICAYVKNMAKDGRYYWVFAIATPIEGGYLSVRLKPGSDFFPVVKEAYKALLAHEHTASISPAESMEHLLGVIKSLGFSGYEEFMAVAIAKEIESRNAQLLRMQEAFLSCFGKLVQQSKLLLKETETIFNSYEDNQYVPMNLQVQSARLGEKGKSIAVISANFSTVSAEIKKEIGIFNNSAQGVFRKIFEGQFLLCTALVQSEVAECFRREATTSGVSGAEQEMDLLNRQLDDYRTKALAGLSSIIANIDKFQGDCRRMRKCAASLEVIRVMGKVDAALLGADSGSLNELIQDLKAFQVTVSDSLMMIEKHTSSMKFDTQNVLKSMEVAA